MNPIYKQPWNQGLSSKAVALPRNWLARAACLGLALSLAGAGLAAQPGDSRRKPPQADRLPANFARHDSGPLTLYVSDALKTELEPERARIDAGMNYLSASYGAAGLRTRPRVWIAANAAALGAALSEAAPRLSAEERRAALEGGLYQTQTDLFVLYPNGSHPDGLLRLLFIDVARRLTVQISGDRLRDAQWFQTGLAAYAGWSAWGRASSMDRAAYESAMFAHYARNFKPESATPLARLERQGDWKRAVRANAAGVYAQAALCSLELARLLNPETLYMLAGLARDYPNFQQAFERATGLRLADFERKLIEGLYPRVREVQPASSAETALSAGASD